MIKEIQLQNWKSHNNTTMSFEKGTNVIVGVMGSGKSSVMDGVCFALYGTFPSLNSRNVKLDEVITSKPNQAEQAVVALKFDYDGKEYSVERRVNRRGANEAKLFEGEKLIGGPQPTDVTEKVEKIIEISYDLFTRAVYSEQNQIDYFIKLSASQRKEKFDELLNLNKYENVRANAVSLQNRLKKIVEDRKALIKERRKDAVLLDVDGERRRLERKSREIELAKEEIGKLESMLDEKKKAVEVLEKKEAEFRFYSELAIKTASRIDQLEKNLAEMRKFAKVDAAGEIEKLQISIKKLGASAEKSAKEMEKLLEEKSLLERKLASEETILKELEKSSKELEGVKGICPVCRRSLEERTKKEIRADNEKHKGDLLGKIKGFEELIGIIKKTIKSSEKERELLLVEKEKCMEKMLEMRQLLEKIEKLKVGEKEISGLNAELENIKKETKKIDFDQAAIVDGRKKAVEYEQKIKSFERELKLHSEMVQEIKNSIERIGKEARHIEELERQVQILSERIEQLSVFVNALKATQAELRNELIGAVNEAMSDIWGRIYPYGDYTDARLAVDEMGSYEIMVRERNGKWVRAGGILSGGEKSIAALTVRISISLVLAQNLSWLILDEPTHNLDTNAVEVMSEIMKEHLPELVEQIFIITHDKEMERAASSTIHVLERDKGEESYTSASQLSAM